MPCLIPLQGKRRESRETLFEGLRELEKFYYEERDESLKILYQQMKDKRIPMQGPYPHKLQSIFHSLNSVKGSMCKTLR